MSNTSVRPELVEGHLFSGDMGFDKLSPNGI